MDWPLCARLLVNVYVALFRKLGRAVAVLRIYVKEGISRAFALLFPKYKQDSNVLSKPYDLNPTL